jgi:hypothetical protein
MVMRNFIKTIFFIVAVFWSQYITAQTKQYIHSVTIKCIAKTETKVNDLIYVKLISKECGSKNTPTKAFKDGEVKTFTEINLDDLSKKNGWSIKEHDVIKVMEDDDEDDDDIIFEMKFTREELLKQRFIYSKTFTIGKYEISFEVKTIKF